MRLYELRDAALASGRLVFSLRQLAKLMGVPESYAKVYAHRLVARGMAWRVRRGVIAFTHDTFVIASQLVEPSYVSMHAALYIRGVADQVPSIVECVTTRSPLWVRELGVRYRKIAGMLFFGYERVGRAGSYAFVALPEKAVLDMVYYGGSPDCSQLDLDVKALREMVEAYRRVGGYRARRVERWVECFARRS
jgi:predicted transcriptional regulator of viral defense system